MVKEGYYRLGFRDIARDTDERTLIAAVVPPQLGAQHKLWLSIPKRYRYDTSAKSVIVEEIPLSRLFLAQALFNSITVDWVLRFSAAISVTKSLLTRLPLPQPGDAELAANPVYVNLCRNSLLLSLYYNPEGFKPLQQQFGIAGKDILHTDKQADMLKIANDILVAELYNINKAEMEQLLKNFKVLNNKKPEYAAGLLAAMPCTRAGATQL